MPKDFSPQDPMELIGVAVPDGDTEMQLDDVVEEYLLMGWAPSQIMLLFRSPYYAATHQIYRRKGEAFVAGRVRRLAERWSQGWIRGGRQDA